VVGEVEGVGNADVEAVGDVEVVEPLGPETFSLRVSAGGVPKGLRSLTFFGRFYWKGNTLFAFALFPALRPPPFQEHLLSAVAYPKRVVFLFLFCFSST